MNWQGVLYASLAAALWGGVYVVSKVVLAVIPPFTLLTIRLLLGMSALGVLVRLQGSVVWPRGATAWRLLGVGVVGSGISLGAQFVGTGLSTAANGALVTSAAPAFIVLFAYFLLGEGLSRMRLVALALATAGAVVVALSTPPNASAAEARALVLGNLALLLAAVTWGLYSVLVKQAAAGTPVLLVTLYALVGGLPVTVPLAAWELATQPLGRVDGWVVAGVLYLGWISTAGAMYLWNKGLALLDASVVSVLFFAQPAVGGLLGWALLHEPIYAGFFAGGALIVAGVWLATRTARASEVTHGN